MCSFLCSNAAEYVKIRVNHLYIGGFPNAGSTLSAHQPRQTALPELFSYTVMSLSTVCINICLNYCLIYGNFGFPELTR